VRSTPAPKTRRPNGTTVAAAEVLYALWLMNDPTLQGPTDAPERTLLVALAVGFLAFPYGLVLILGGRAMRDLSGRAGALAAAVVAIGSFVLYSEVCVCALLPVPVGIWGLIAVNHPAVRRAFEANRGAAADA
jgi:hypothetical protein